VLRPGVTYIVELRLYPWLNGVLINVEGGIKFFADQKHLSKGCFAFCILLLWPTC